MGKVIVLAVVGLALFFGLGYAGCALDFRSDCVRSEAGIKAQYDQDKNNYDSMWKKFREMSQVPTMYSDDLKKVYDGAIQSRYGKDGSKAVFQFIKEANPNFDATMYTRLQVAIEAGRNSFADDQKQLIDRKREYETLLNGNKALAVNFLFNFPHIDLNKYGIVTSEATDNAFETKKADEVKLR